MLMYIAEPGKYFAVKEMACKCGCGKVMFDVGLRDKLDALRELVGKAVYISSGYRCPEHNAHVGGVHNSYHTRGIAADIYAKGIPPRALAKMAEEIGFDGIGIYKSFVHVDVRGYKARWQE